MSICCHRSELLGADRVIWRGRPGECQRRGGDEGGVEAACTGEVVLKREGESRVEVVGGSGGSVWSGPLGPLNWHVQARGRDAGALIRHVTGTVLLF